MNAIQAEQYDQDQKPFSPDWCIAPGATIQALAISGGINLFSLCGMLSLTPEQTRKLIVGDLRIDNELAYRLASNMGGTIGFWESRERTYRNGLAKGLKNVSITLALK